MAMPCPKPNEKEVNTPIVFNTNPPCNKCSLLLTDRFQVLTVDRFFVAPSP